VSRIFSDKTEFGDDSSFYGDVTVFGELNKIKIQVVGSTLNFTVAGIGSTSLTLS
tara:strand:+ start:486 stop:650 length:165 start_codon:yes stop_codon:yes gene_type:complete